MPDARSYELYPASKQLNLSVVADKIGLATANQLTIAEMFLDRVKQTQTSTSSSTTVSFANAEQITLTISGVSASILSITLSDIEDNGRYILKIIKDTGKTISFTGANSVEYGAVYIQTSLYYEIIAVGGYITVKRLDYVITGTIPGLACSINIGVLDSVSKFNFKINSNVCNFDIKFTVSAAISDFFRLTFTGFNYEMATTECSLSAFAVNDDDEAYICSSLLTDGVIELRLASATDGSFATTFYVNGSFIIK